MEIFCRLLFGHFLADFTFQTNHIAAWKRKSMHGLLTHVAIHPLCYLALTWPYVTQMWRTPLGFYITGWMAILVATALHFLEDWVRVTLVNRDWADNTLFYVWDQVVHIAVLWLLCPVGIQPLENKWPLLGVLFVLVTHFATVTVWFIEKDIFGRDYPETEEKYISMLQRLVLWLSFFLPYPWWIFVIVFVLFTYGQHIARRKIDYTLTSVILGQVMALIAGFVSRFLLGFHF